MTKRQKLLDRLNTLPNDFTFNELEVILKQYGFIKVKTNAGSHFKWRNSEKNILYAAPRKNPIKKIYLKQLLEILLTHFS